jgi:DUF1365 family protein
MNSCIYEGRVHHRRAAPEHAFSYGMFMMYLDLDELPALFERRWLWSFERANLASFRRADYFGDPAEPLAMAVHKVIEQRTGEPAEGPVRLLTHLRYLGYAFNPVNFYFCYDRGDRHVEAVVAEVNNTPWKERHVYVLQVPPARRGEVKQRFHSAKEFHVSPFMDMDMTYDWSFSMPGRELVVHIGNRARGRRVFDATLALRRREITTLSLAHVLARHPFMTARISGAIYTQALRLWLKGAPFFEHPRFRRARSQPNHFDFENGVERETT